MKIITIALIAAIVPHCSTQNLFHSSNIPTTSGKIDTDLDGDMDYFVISPKGKILLRFRESIDVSSFNIDEDIVPMPFLNIRGEFTSTLHENDTLVLSPLEIHPPGAMLNIILRANSIKPADPDSTLTLAEVSLFLKVWEKQDSNHPYIIRTDATCNRLKIEFSEEMESLNIYAKQGYPELPTNMVVDSSNNPEYGARFPDGLESDTIYILVIDPLNTKDLMGTCDTAGNPLVDIAESAVPRKVEWVFTTGSCKE